MHPRDFRDYWQLKNSELADLLSYKLDGVQQWFRTGADDPPQFVLDRLSELHTRFLAWEAEDKNLPSQYKEIFQTALERRRSL